MRRAVRSLAAALAIVASLVSPGAAHATVDPAGAERQYRIARRLLVERSPEAQGALAKVVELDPAGDLADDALLEQALLLDPPRWPEDLGRIGAADAQRVLALLGSVADQLARGDRAAEARYRHSLLLLEPLAGRDASRARVGLLAVASAEVASDWASAARYTLAWLAENEGKDERALATYQRLLVDGPAGGAAVRASAGLGRMLLRQGSYDRAARWLDLAIEAGAGVDLDAPSLRELAVRSLLREARASAALIASAPLAAEVQAREPIGLCATRSGGTLLADRKEGRIVELDAQGAPVGEWSVEELEAIAVDPQGRGYAAAGGSLLRLLGAGRREFVASLGDHAPSGSIAIAGGCGAFWILDRRGQRLGHLAPGAQQPRPVWEDRGLRLSSLVWDGRRLAALDGRSKSLVVFDGRGSWRALAAIERRPIALSADPAGRLAVLDDRGAVTLFRVDGSLIESLPASALGAARSEVLALGRDGSLFAFDPSASRWVKRP